MATGGDCGYVDVAAFYLNLPLGKCCCSLTHCNLMWQCFCTTNECSYSTCTYAYGGPITSCTMWCIVVVFYVYDGGGMWRYNGGGVSMS